MVAADTPTEILAPAQLSRRGSFSIITGLSEAHLHQTESHPVPWFWEGLVSVPKVMQPKCRGQEDTVYHLSEDSTASGRPWFFVRSILIDPFHKSNSLMTQVHSLRLTLVGSVASACTVPEHHLAVFQNYNDRVSPANAQVPSRGKARASYHRNAEHGLLGRGQAGNRWRY